MAYSLENQLTVENIRTQTTRMTVKHLSVTWMCESDVLTSRTSDKKTDNSRCNQIETQAASWNDGRGVLPPGRPLFPLVSFLTGAVERVHRTEIPYGLV